MYFSTRHYLGLLDQLEMCNSSLCAQLDTNHGSVVSCKYLLLDPCIFFISDYHATVFHKGHALHIMIIGT